ncbi:hypothetical protein [Dactylosporangium salmoneum]|uniref:Lipoprotein n=1 Tax=Dactylosporangium salmoneum TaxID=53361 RepID=A0ABN3HMM5_9ACTN
MIALRLAGVVAAGAVGVSALLMSSGARVLPAAAPSPSMAPPPAYPSPVVTGPGSQAVNCAAIPNATTGQPLSDSPGDLVPAGVVAVTRCDTPLTTPPPTVAPPEVLTEHVDSFVRLLNTLPAVPAGQACFHIAFPTQLSFVFSFDPSLRRPPQVLVVDRGCAALVTTTADGITTRARSYAQLDPMPIFDKLWAAQPPP